MLFSYRSRIIMNLRIFPTSPKRIQKYKQYQSVFYENTVACGRFPSCSWILGNPLEKKGFEIKYDWMVFL
jgi:hypothetical protein